jgi:hypothetical protein
MVDFPDHSAQEDPIRVVGKAELLRKRGILIFRVNKSLWGSERDVDKYDRIKDLISGRVLAVGLGMGNSADMILKRAGVTELVSYEIEQDIADVFEAEHKADPKHKIEVADAYTATISGTFDVVLFELEADSQALYDKAKAFLDAAKKKLNRGGFVLTKADRFYEAIANDLASGYNCTVISKTQGRRVYPLFFKLDPK